MSAVVINLKNTTSAYNAVRGNVRLEFTHNATDNVISGGFQKLNGEGEAIEHMGGAHVSADGYPSVSLSKQDESFVADWKVCVDLLNDAINYINNLGNE